MWAEASRSSWTPGVPSMELLDLNVRPDGFQFCLSPYYFLFLFVSFEEWKYLLYDTLCWKYITCFSTLTGFEAEFALSLGGDIELDL